VLVLGVAVLPGIAHAESAGGTLYVSPGQSCSDSGTGSEAVPFCTLQAAADVAAAGQTVVVHPAAYREKVTITHSGTAAAPITFRTSSKVAKAGFFVNSLAVTGASHLRFEGAQGASIVVSGSSDVSFDNALLSLGTLHVTDGSTGVSLTRSEIYNRSSEAGSPIVIDKGSANTVVSGNIAYPPADSQSPAPLISVDGATGTAVTGNTLRVTCGAAVGVGGKATTTTVENNVVTATPSGGACKPPAPVRVSGDSAAQTKSAYNLFDLPASAVVYDWAGTSYSSLPAFRSATGQGAHDLTGSADERSNSLCEGRYAPAEGSPAIDSADASAPGALATDFWGTARADDPGVANSGTGAGYHDRGALELTNCMDLGPYDGGAPAKPYGARGVWVPVTVYQNWALPGKITVDWGDGTTSSDPFTGTQTVTVRHSYDHPGTYSATITATAGGLTRTRTVSATTEGSQYRPVAPTRVLDTRNGTGTGGVTAAVPARGVQHLDLTGVLPSADVTGVVVNITAVSPGADGFVTAYATGTERPATSALNFTRGAVIANLATLNSGKIDLFNGSSAATELVVDLEGYYLRGAGDGYHPVSPTRLLDTRAATATRPAQKVPAGGSVTVKVAGSGSVPKEATAATLNVTEADATAAGFITAYPAGAERPTASNLNFTAGAIVPNSTVVPLGSDGAVTFHNGSSAPVSLIVDLQGYYSPTGGLAFAAVTPQRVLDTRDGTGVENSAARPVPAQGVASAGLGWLGTWGPFGHEDAKAAVLSTTVTRPASSGYLTVYPSGVSRPTASNLNFTANQTLAALTVTGLGPDAHASFFNGSGGTVDVISDVTGYFY